MRTIISLFTLMFFSLNFYGQKSDKISVTTERKYTINGESITEKDTVTVSKAKLLKTKNIDTTKTYFVIYDFKKGEYVKGLVKPKVDRPIVYKIININRLAYDVQVNTDDIIVAETDWFTSAEDLKKITGLISESNANIQAKAEETINVPNITSTNPVSKDDKIDVVKIIKLDSLNIRKSTIEFKLQKLEKNKNIQDDLINNSQDSLNPADTSKMQKEIDDEKVKLDIIKKEILNNENLTNEKLIEFQNSKENFKKAYDEYIKSYNDINTIVQASTIVIPISNLPFLNKEEYQSKHKVEFDLIFSRLKEIDVKPNSLNDQYDLLVIRYNEIVNIKGLDKYFEKASYKKYLNDVEVLFENAKKLKFKAELINFEKLSQQVQRIINLLEKDETYEYISSPIQPKNDIATFDVDIKAKNNDVEINNSRKFKHSEFVKGGTRIDFSIGLAGSYFANANAYEIYTIEGQNKIGLKSKYVTAPSLVTMISMTNRASRYLAIGGSAGLGLETNNGKIQLSNFFIGPTLVFGKYDRMMVTPGLALRNVGKLKNGYFVDDTIITQSSDIDTVLSDDYKLGFFVALTYNLTKNVRDKISNYK